MATLILRLDVDPATKKKTVWVKYESDGDALPMEHEEQHKKIVEALLAGGQLKPEELSSLTIQREGQGAAAPSAPSEAPAEKKSVAQKG